MRLACAKRPTENTTCWIEFDALPSSPPTVFDDNGVSICGRVPCEYSVLELGSRSRTRQSSQEFGILRFPEVLPLRLQPNS